MYVRYIGCQLDLVSIFLSFQLRKNTTFTLESSFIYTSVDYYIFAVDATWGIKLLCSTPYLRSKGKKSH